MSLPQDSVSFKVFKWGIHLRNGRAKPGGGGQILLPPGKNGRRVLIKRIGVFWPPPIPRRKRSRGRQGFGGRYAPVRWGNARLARCREVPGLGAPGGGRRRRRTEGEPFAFLQRRIVTHGGMDELCPVVRDPFQRAFGGRRHGQGGRGQGKVKDPESRRGR